jgi:hypothetical protein
MPEPHHINNKNSHRAVEALQIQTSALIRIIVVIISKEMLILIIYRYHQKNHSKICFTTVTRRRRNRNSVSCLLRLDFHFRKIKSLCRSHDCQLVKVVERMKARVAKKWILMRNHSRRQSQNRIHRSCDILRWRMPTLQAIFKLIHQNPFKIPLPQLDQMKTYHRTQTIWQLQATQLTLRRTIT